MWLEFLWIIMKKDFSSNNTEMHQTGIVCQFCGFFFVCSIDTRNRDTCQIGYFHIILYFACCGAAVNIKYDDDVIDVLITFLFTLNWWYLRASCRLELFWTTPKIKLTFIIFVFKWTIFCGYTCDLSWSLVKEVPPMGMGPILDVLKNKDHVLKCADFFFFTKVFEN